MARVPNPADDLVVRSGRADGVGVVVEGLRGFRRELREVDRDLPKALRRANKQLAEAVKKRAEGRAQRLGSVHRHVVRVAGYKVRAQQAGAQLVIKHPAAAGAEFGAYRYKQFPPFIGGRGGRGYMVYGVIADEGDELAASYLDIVSGALRDAFPD